MRPSASRQNLYAGTSASRKAFTLAELLVVVMIIAILAALVLPALGKAKERGQCIACCNNVRQLSLAWSVYADEHEGRLAYNLAMTGSSFRTNMNWVNDVLSWDLNPDNTNLDALTGASLGYYVSRSVDIYRCPSDRSISSVQNEAGWGRRVRSYSLNAMMGDAGEASSAGHNINNPDYRQYFKMMDIDRPSELFAFLDEHPDSIDDGYFLNKAPVQSDPGYFFGFDYGSPEWTDLPASYHNRSTEISYADGHVALHKWQGKKILQRVQHSSSLLPLTVGPKADDKADFDWILSHMSTRH